MLQRKLFWNATLGCAIILPMVLEAGGPPAPAAETSRKEASVFYPRRLIEISQANIRKYVWAAALQKQAIEAAQPWKAKSDEELWSLMFGPTIRRAWHVWSSGFCPACRNSVPMYNWQIDALKRPWKVRCPHCQELFPKNDFAAFYRSGLDEHGIFDPARADRSLLFNAEHPDPADPLHLFGVDDGEGYVEGDHRWRFIGAYLIYGQWKQAVLGGIQALSWAYLLIGDRAYAHKAGILLDRVADLYPSFDFRTQGVMYEGPAAAGYVSTWHDACEETRELALAYDRVFMGLREDTELVAFLSRQAEKYGLSPPKNSWADVQRHIEEGLLRDPINNPGKIVSNYPRQTLALIVLRAVLDEPGYREEIGKMTDEMLRQATAVDGVTGEKGLAGYSSYVIQGLAQFLAEWERSRPGFLAEILQRYPQLHQTYRFHIDTWCLQQYYPLSGDTGSFARKIDRYVGVAFHTASPLDPSMFTFLWRLYELTGDAAFVQALYHANGESVEGLPHDLFLEDPESLQQKVAEVIAREGTVPQLGSVNKQQWRLAILRSGQGPHARAVWLDYDAGGGHGHADGMNLGLFAYGLDLLPDFGYPPVQYGGWAGPKFSWYVITPSHNTVVVDGQSQPAAAGRTTLWTTGQAFQVLRASGPELIGGSQFERTVALVDLSERDFYVVDLFRVVGGKDHAKFLHSHFGQIETAGLSLQPAEEYGHGALMRNFQGDRQAQPGWSVDWKIEDRYGYLPPGSDVHLRYTDLTKQAEAYIAEAWVSIGGFTGTEEAWIPRILVRRQAEAAPLASTFVGVIEPYEKTSSLGLVRRLPLETSQGVAYSDANVAVEVQLQDGRRDLFVAADVENPLGLTPALADQKVLVQPDWAVKLEGEACFVRQDVAGRIQRLALCRGRFLQVGEVEVALKTDVDCIEVVWGPDGPAVVAGDPEAVQALRFQGRELWGEGAPS